MKVIMAPVEMVARFDLHGNPEPARFAYAGRVIDVQQILDVREERLAGNRMKIFVCQSDIDDKLMRYEIKFELQTMKWFLYKM